MNVVWFTWFIIMASRGANWSWFGPNHGIVVGLQKLVFKFYLERTWAEKRLSEICTVSYSARRTATLSMFICVPCNVCGYGMVTGLVIYELIKSLCFVCVFVCVGVSLLHWKMLTYIPCIMMTAALRLIGYHKWWQSWFQLMEREGGGDQNESEVNSYWIGVCMDNQRSLPHLV